MRSREEKKTHRVAVLIFLAYFFVSFLRTNTNAIGSAAIDTLECRHCSLPHQLVATNWRAIYAESSQDYRFLYLGYITWAQRRRYDYHTFHITTFKFGGDFYASSNLYKFILCKIGNKNEMKKNVGPLLFLTSTFLTIGTIFYFYLYFDVRLLKH